MKGLFTKAKDWYEEKWHRFKVWFCADEVGYFQLEVKRIQQQLEEEKWKGGGQADAIRELNEELDEMRRERSGMLAIDLDKVLRVASTDVMDNGVPRRKDVLILNGTQLNPEQTKILKDETAYLKRTEIWSLFQNSIADQAREVMFTKSQSFDDMRTGKAMLYNLSVLKKIVEKIENV